MTQMASLLAVATAFVCLWTLNISQRGGAYTRGGAYLRDSTVHTSASLWKPRGEISAPVFCGPVIYGDSFPHYAGPQFAVTSLLSSLSLKGPTDVYAKVENFHDPIGWGLNYTVAIVLPALTGKKECTPTLFPASITGKQ
jgi:hypothetical protein